MGFNFMNDKLRKRLAAIEGQAEHKDAIKTRSMPNGWEPGVVWDGSQGEITTDPSFDPNANWDDLLAARGLDPEVYEIYGDTIRWTSFDGWKRDAPGEEAYSTICYSFKAVIRKKTSSVEKEAIPEDIYQAVLKAKKRKKPAPTGDAHFLVALSDWQTGNRDGGGLELQVERITELVTSIPDRIKHLRGAGNNIGHVVIAGLGDLVEGTCGHYAAQQYRIEADRREQVKLVRRGIRDIIMAVSPIVDKVTVLAIGGNHGENRGLAGKAFTSTGDNDDVAIFEQLAETFSMNPEVYGNVGFKLPLEQLTLSINLSGKVVAFTHGHLSKAGGNAGQAVWNWWKDQAMGRAHEGVADADILVTGHYHHLNVKEQEGRAVLVCPSLTAVGEYFQDAYGVKTRAGTLNFTVDENGWNNLHLL
jgi:predicted phosphodiesterase